MRSAGSTAKRSAGAGILGSGFGALRAVDPILLLTSLALVATGILFVYSSGVNSAGVSVSNEWLKQIVWAASGLVLMVVFAVTNHQRFKARTPYIFLAALALLVVTLMFGRQVNGARSWLGIGDLGIQPSEFVKIATILFLAAYLSEIGNGITELPRFVLGLLVVAAPVGLIVLQPDMGTALIYCPIFLTMALMAGARIRHLLFVTLLGALMLVFAAIPAMQNLLAAREPGIWRLVTDAGVARYSLLVLGAVAALAVVGQRRYGHGYYYWILYGAILLGLAIAGGLAMSTVLKEYQIMRLVIFVNPWVDPRGAGWNIIQSVTAVGAGGMSGTGFLQGTQSHLRYLPQQSTDFIFSILAEESGFLGGVLVLLLFAVMLARGLVIMYAARDPFATLIAAGVVAMILFHAVVNIGMAMGVLPITGIPLMLVSYGGSSLWTAMIGIGLLMNVGIARIQGRRSPGWFQGRALRDAKRLTRRKT